MAVGIIMPRQGQSVESCIIQWKVKEGDTVKAGDILFGYETDKASFEEASPADGTVLKLLAADGDDVPCLQTVLVIGKPGEDISALVEPAVARYIESHPLYQTT
jgi:pyruvate dehydrogenase E2 component (dihydrolipoamide acetyltransferase)